VAVRIAAPAMTAVALAIANMISSPPLKIFLAALIVTTAS
jgi:hypothetical protein